MKKTTYILIAFAALLAAASCSQVREADLRGERSAIRFSTSVGNYAVKAGDTYFDDGDEIGLFALAPINAYDVRLRVQNGTPVSSELLYWGEDQTDPTTFAAYYPYTSGFIPTRTSAFQVYDNQSWPEALSASDLMLAVAEAGPSEDVVNLPFKHVLSKVVVRVDNRSSHEIRSIYLTNVEKTAYVNAVGPVDKSEFLASNVGEVRFCQTGRSEWAGIIPPQERTPRIVLTTEDNRSVSFKPESLIRFDSGVRTVISLTLTDDLSFIEFTSSIADWEEQYAGYLPVAAANLYVLNGDVDNTLYLYTLNNANNGWTYLSSLYPYDTKKFGEYTYDVYDISELAGLPALVSANFSIGTSRSFYFEASEAVYAEKTPADFYPIYNPGRPYDHDYYTSEVSISTLPYIPDHPYQTYRVSGIVGNIQNRDYGNFYLFDDDGNSIYVYGLVDSAGNWAFSNLGIVEGDEITVVSTKNTYNGTPELNNARFVEFLNDIKGKEWSVIGDFIEPVWENDVPMSWDADERYFYAVIPYVEGNSFKIRANQSWDYNYGAAVYQWPNVALSANGSGAVNAERDGANIVVDLVEFRESYSGTLAVLYYPDFKTLAVFDGKLWERSHRY